MKFKIKKALTLFAAKLAGLILQVLNEVFGQGQAV